MKIPGLEQRPRRPTIEELPEPTRSRAWQWLNRLLTQARRKGRRLDPWYLAILHGQAKRLATNPPTSQWGRSMLAKRGGRAVQRMYRTEGREPTSNATDARRAIHKLKAREAERTRRGLPPSPRTWYLPI